MEIEKVMTVGVPAQQAWAMLLDPQTMGRCVPGMKSIEVLSETEYLAQMEVKISFVSASFNLRTILVEQRPPHYLRAEGTGEDSKVGGALRQQTEIFLTELPSGHTQLRIKVQVDLLGRLGTFGLSIMKTKADRMWEEFGRNLVDFIESGGRSAPSLEDKKSSSEVVAPSLVLKSGSSAQQAVPHKSTAGGWFSRWCAKKFHPHLDGQHIFVEIKRSDLQVQIYWPVQHTALCKAWLDEVLKPSK